MKIFHKSELVATFNGVLSITEAVAFLKSGQLIEVDPADITLEMETRQEKNKILRQEITIDAGDIPSLLGTTSDGMQLILLAFSEMTVALNSANSLADVRAAAEPFNELASNFLAQLKEGVIKLPFQVKGTDNVLKDIGQRATAVTNAITKHTD